MRQTTFYTNLAGLVGCVVATVALTSEAEAQVRRQVRPQPQVRARAQAKKPNILVIMGDDVGIPNISAYTHGLMGYQTPNIDRIAKEGVMFTDYYGEQSCTAGRSAFITGQCPFRVGLTKVGSRFVLLLSKYGRWEELRKVCEEFV